MKKTVYYFERILSLIFFLLIICPFNLEAQTTYDWLNTAPDGNWKQGASGARWNPGGLYDEPTSGTGAILQFNNNHYNSMTNNVGYTYEIHKIIFGNSNTDQRTIGGSNSVQLFEYGTTWPRIENTATNVSHIINFPLIGSSNSSYNLELVASGGSLQFGGGIDNNGQSVLVYGNNSAVDATNRYVQFNSNVSGSGKLGITLFGVGKVKSALSYSGDTDIDNGELWIEENGDITSGTIYLGNGSQMTNTAKFFLAKSDGGTNFTRSISVNDGNSGTRVVGGLNVSGTNTFSGNIIRSGSQPLALEVVNSNGTLDISGVINGSGDLEKVGTGTLSLSGNNTYTGNTTITGGTLTLGASDRITNTSDMILNGGEFSSAGYNETVGTLSLTENSSITLDASSHTLTFANSSSESWTAGKVLTVYGWTGSANTTGTNGKLFIGSDNTGLTSGQLAQIQFDGYPETAAILSTGEIVPACEYAASPASDATSLSFNTISGSGMTLLWTNGDGANRLVVAKQGGAVTASPTDNTSYTADAAFGSGDDLGTGEYVVYNGSSNTVSVTGLTSSNTYHFKIFEYNGTGCPSAENYYTEGTPLYGSQLAEDVFETAADGDWTTAGTWVGNNIPDGTDNVLIKHDVDITTDLSAKTHPKITVESGAGLTFGTSGVLYVTDLTTDGTIDMTAGGNISISDAGSLSNNATFTGGSGKITFLGAGTVSGSITFNDVEVQGSVNFGGSASLSGILSINGGSLSTNSITYNSGSTLKYIANYTINSGDKAWYSNTPSSGSAQEGIPWNVEIASGISLTFNDSYQFDMNGSLINNGTFTLGTASDPDYGDLALRGNFTNNGTFIHNSRTVKFIGTAQQSIGGTSETVFAYLIAGNPAGIKALSHFSIDNILTLTDGLLSLGNFDLTFNSGAGVSGGSDGSYILTDGSGYCIREAGTTETLFPVGTSGGYAPAWLTQNDAGGAEVFSIRVKQSIDEPTNNNDYAVNLQWMIIETTPDNNDITTKFQWSAADEGQYFDRSGDIQIGRYISTAYTANDALFSGDNPYTAEAGSMTDDISSETSFIVANEVAFSANGYTTAQNGSWSTTSTWTNGVVPPAGAVCGIGHHVTVSSDYSAVVYGDITIHGSKSLSIQSGGNIAVNSSSRLSNYGSLKTNASDAVLSVDGIFENYPGASLNMANGGTLNFGNAAVFNNKGSFIAGSGTVEFAGVGTGDGTLVFNNLNITGGNVDLGASASLNGTLTVSGTGDLTTNSLTYNEGSLLKFDRDYSLANTVLWKNTASDGTPQAGVPWNVKIAEDRSVQYTSTDDHYINGNLTISAPSSGTTLFDLGDGTNAGAFFLRGDFINDGTFTHRNQSVTFNGTERQVISGTSIDNFYDLILDNSAGLGLGENLTLDHDLTFSAGKLYLGNKDLTASGTINSANASKYVVTGGNGYLILTSTTVGTAYPVGTNFSYNPITLTKATTDEQMSVRVQNSIDHIVSDPTQIVTMQWTIDEATANGDDISVDLQWNKTEEASSFVRGTNLEMAYYNSGYSNASATLTGTDPYTASRTITGSSVAVSNMPFIVANNGAFTATVFETISNGDWMATSTWSGSITPSANDIAVIKHNVTSSMDWTVKAVSIDNGASLNCGSNTLNISNGGAIANSGTFNSGTGTVSFTGSGSISTGDISFNHVEINGEVSFGSNSTVNGTLQLNPGGSVRNNPPIYGSSSILKYSTGNIYNRSDEWKPNTDEGPGFPNIVQISKSGTYTSTLTENKSINEELYCRGIITDEACSYEMTELSEKPLIVNGDLIINGTFSFSSQAGGDLKVSGDFIKGENGSIDWGDNNGRAVFFTGTSTYTQTVSGISSIPFILQTGNGNLQLNNDLNITGSGTNFLSMLGGGTINLNGNNLISVGKGQIDLGNTSGASIEGAGRVEFNGGDGSFSGTNSGTLEFGENTTLAINGGTLSFPSTLGIVTLLGTLEIGDGTTISSLPTYGPSSELHYKKSGSFNPGDEWQAGSDQADNIPFDITLSEGTSDVASLILDDERYAFGTLTINNNANFIIASETGHLSVNDIIVNSGGLLQLNSPSNMGATASLYISGSVSNSGSMQARRFFSGNKTNKNLYHYFTPPNASTSSSLFTNSHSSGNFNPNLIWYNESYDAATNPTSTDNSEWDNFTAAWEPAHDGSSGSGIALTEGKGYAFYNDENRTYTFSGDFLSSDVNTDVSFTPNDANSDYFDGWNMIGNPFTCALDWESDSWDKTYIGNTIYYWDGAEGNYKYYNDASGTQADEADNVLNGGSQFIPAMQAFFVKSTYTNTLSFTIPEAARTYSTQGFFKKKSSKKSFKADYLKLELTVENKADESILRFIPEAPDKADNQYDAYKMFTNNLEYPQLFSLSEDNIPLAINSMSSKTDNFTVPLGFTVKQEGLHNFTLNLKSFVFQNKRVFLEDKETGYYEDISSAPEYSFTALGGTDIRDRLVLHILQNQAPEIQITLSDIETTYGEQLTFNIPEGAFIDPEGDKISYSSNASKAEELVWLYFNKESLEFSGTAPATGDYELIIYAEDSFGAQASDTLIIQVNKAELTVSAEDAERYYAEENPEFKLNYSGFVGNDSPAEIEELPKTHTEAEVLSPAGSYPIELSGGLDNNYAFDLIDGTLSISAIKPKVLSEKVYNIEPDKVKAVGEILSDGGTEIIENGFCFAFHQNPDITDTHITAEINQSVFEAEISELQPNTQYYLRAYAQNSQGIAYGESLAFKTSLTNVSNPTLRLQANIYPNPSKGIFKTELNISGAGLIQITDKAGKIIFLSKAQFEDGVNIINLSHLAKGEYNIELSVKGKHITKKISIQ